MEKKLASKAKVSSKDVARLAGVSQATVSRAFNETYNLSPDLKKKVFEAAKKLEYRPNAIARSLLSNRSNMIGIVTSRLDNPFYSHALQCFVKKLQENALQSLVFVAEHNEDIDTVVNRVLSYQVDLVLLFGARSTTLAAKTCVEHGTPTVLFNRYIPMSQTSAVCCNDHQCARLIADELYGSGCRNFVYVSGDESSTTDIDRKNGFISELQSLGINTCKIIPGGYTYEAGINAAKMLLDVCPNVDACFCVNDITAMGVLDYLRFVAKKKVPDEVCLVGFDDIPQASQLSYQLTTVRQPIEQMVDATIATILDTLKDSNIKPVLKIIEGDFIRRNTTRPFDHHV